MTRRLTPETTITTAEAAALVGVATSTINTWRWRRKLEPVTAGARGKGRAHIYTYATVLAAERSTRQRGQSKRLKYRRAIYGC